MKKTLIWIAGLVVAATAFAQLGQFPNLPKPNDSAQTLGYKIASATNGGLMVPPHDAKVYAYSGSNLTSITLKVGGRNGRTVGMIIYSYSGSNVISEELTVQ